MFRSTLLLIALLPLAAAFSIVPPAQLTRSTLTIHRSASSSEEIFNDVSSKLVNNKRPATADVVENLSATAMELKTKVVELYKDERTQELVAKASATAKDLTIKAQEMWQDEELRAKVVSKAQDLKLKAQEIYEDERTQELIGKASDFAKDVAGKVFDKINTLKAEQSNKN
jgi:hypothetical protein